MRHPHLLPRCGYGCECFYHRCIGGDPRQAPTLSLRELVRSGLTVGHDMIGTMSNTLILAYTGTATGTLLTLYAYEMPYIQMMSYNAIVIEILSGLCGTIGVVLTVPIQTLITAFVITRKK